MLCKSPPTLRPLYLFRDGTYEVQWHTYSADGESIICDDSRVTCDKIVNLSYLVGVLCYGVECRGDFIVFDFSHSRLCPRQLRKIQDAIVRQWSVDDRVRNKQ